MPRGWFKQSERHRLAAKKGWLRRDLRTRRTGMRPSRKNTRLLPEQQVEKVEELRRRREQLIDYVGYLGSFPDEERMTRMPEMRDALKEINKIDDKIQEIPQTEENERVKDALRENIIQISIYINQLTKEGDMDEAVRMIAKRQQMQDELERLEKETGE